MKKQQVDTPYRNSWADRISRGSLEIVKPQTHPVVLGLKIWNKQQFTYDFLEWSVSHE